MYATITDLRDEGVTESQASDARLTALIDEASRAIDRITGWFFEPRSITLRMDGRDSPSIEPQVPPIELSLLTIDGEEISLDPNDLIIIGAPVQLGFCSPRLTLCNECVFPKGNGNVLATGIWGYTEEDGSPYGRTPLGIRRACMLLVMRNLPLLGNEDEAADARNRWRVIEEKTRDQSYKLDRLAAYSEYTGDPEIDRILMQYRRPAGMGAA